MASDLSFCITSLMILAPFLICVPRVSPQSSKLSENSVPPMSFQPTDIILINCGASGTANDSDGRSWKGDSVTSSASFSSNSSFPASADYSQASSVPYDTARVFNSKGTYRFSVSSGRHWIRLHFFAVSYAGRDPANALFSVEAKGESHSRFSYTLLRDFSVKAPSDSYIMKEFSVTVGSDELELIFTPNSKEANSSFSYYAFVNGIEIVSMPNIFTSVKIPVVGTQSESFAVAENYATQTMARLNVGGASVSPSKDSNLSRAWYDDSSFIYGAAFGVTVSVTDKALISYSQSDPPYFAPSAVYSTARSMGPVGTINLRFNLTWLIPVDANFTYLARLHFCEIFYSKPNQRVFTVLINNETAMGTVDVIDMAQQINPENPKNTALFQDFAVTVTSISETLDLWIAMRPNPSSKPQYYDAFLNGLEIFKINDSSGNLAGANPVALATGISPTASEHPNPKSNSPTKGLLIGVLSGVGFILAGFLIWGFRCRKRGLDRSACLLLITKPFYQLPSFKRVTVSASDGPGDLCRHFTFAELKESTKNFDKSLLLGVGGFGNVYVGLIDGNRKVAIKRGNPNSQQGASEFQTEIQMLSKLRHKHLVSLVGFCNDSNEMILVYDYMSKGTLKNHLCKKRQPNSQPLTWKQRLEICTGAAKGLHYLHTGARQPLIHRDIKSTNILLDDNLVAKVADFGLSKTGPAPDQTHVSTAVRGTFGYVDPEYFRLQQLTVKSDVYSFGVLLFEVLSARPAVSPSPSGEQVNLAEWALFCKKNGVMETILDPCLRGKIDADSLKKFTDIAEKCIAEKGSERPSMGDVLWNLECALQFQKNAIERKSVEDSVIEVERKSVEDSAIEMVEEPESFVYGEFSGQDFVSDGACSSQGVSSNSTAGKVINTEDSEETTPTEIFSFIVNPTGG